MISNTISLYDCLISGLSSQVSAKAKRRCVSCATPLPLSPPLREALVAVGCRVTPTVLKGSSIEFQCPSAWHVVSALKFLRAYELAILDATPERVFPFHSLLSPLEVILQQSDKILMVKYLKYLTVEPFNRYWDQPSADKPLMTSAQAQRGLVPYSGPVRRYLMSVLGRGGRTERTDRLLLTLLQGVKRACQAVSDDFVDQARLKHRAALSQPQNISWFDAGQLEVYARRLFKKFRPRPLNIGEASTAACFCTPRSAGGAREDVKDNLDGHLTKKQLDIPASEVLARFFDELGLEDLALRAAQAPLDDLPDVKQSDFAPVDELASMNELGELRIARPSEGITRNEVLRYARGVLSDRPSGDRMFGDMRANHVHARVEAVLEPLKVRLITKSDSFRQWLARHLQQEMHRFLRRIPAFRLIGEVLDCTHLDRLVERYQRLGFNLERSEWVSADYEAATDNLKMEATKIVFEEIIAHLPEEERFLAPLYRDILYEQTIHSKLSDKSDIVYLQTSGQLMGSVLSFPVLCAVNFCLYWQALEERLACRKTGFEGVRPEAVPVLVNGDDFLAPMEQDLYVAWVDIPPRHGLKFSVGKSYKSKCFAMINSRQFRVILADGKVLFREVLFTNLGLVTGQSKVSGRQAEWDRPLSQIYNDVVGSAQSPELITALFIRYHKEDIARATDNGNYNLFLPTTSGGLGFDPTFAKFDVTPFQRRYATFVQATLTKGPPRKEEMPVGLVPTYTAKEAARPPTLPILRNLRDFVKVPLVGPLGEGLVRSRPKEPEALLLGGCLISDSAIQVKLPKRASLRAFRRAPWSMMKPNRCARPIGLAFVKAGFRSTEGRDKDGLCPESFNMEKKSKRTTSVKKTKAARKQVAAPAAISVTTKGMVPAVRTEGTDIVVTHEELFAIVEGASIAVGIGSTTNGANVHNYLINPTETSVFPWLAAIADRYEKYRVEDLEIAYVPMVGTATRGQVVLSVDFDPADEMSTEPTMDTRMMLTSKPDSISMPVWQLGTLRCAQPRLKRVGERFVRNWAGEQEIIGPISRTSDMGVLSIGLFNVDESLSHVVYGDLRVRYRIRLMTPQLQLPEAEQPSEGSIELANPGGLSPKFDLKTGELSASGFATATTWRAGPYIIEPLLATQLYTTAVGATPHAMVRLKEDCEGRLTLRGQVRAFTAFTSDLVSFLPSWAAFFTPQNVGGVVRLPAVPMAMADEMDRYYYGNSAFDGTITRSAMSDLFKIKQRYEVSNVTSTSTHFDLVLELVGRFVKGTVLHFLCNPTIWMGTYSAAALELTNLKMAMTPRASLSKNYINTALAVHTVRADPKTGVPRLTTEPVVGSTTPVNRSIVYN